MSRIRIRSGNPPRTSLSLTDLNGRTPIVENFLSMLPNGHEKALKYAFFNVLAAIIAAVGIIAFWGVYCILEPFIKPLLWALLTGSVLHRFKEGLCTFARSWLKGIKSSPTPFTLKVLTSPLKIVDMLSEEIGSKAWTLWKPICSGISVFFITYIIYHNPPVTLVVFAQMAVQTLVNSCLWIVSWINLKIVFTLNVLYIASFAHYLANRKNEGDKKSEDEIDSEDQGNIFFTLLSYFTWSMTLLFIIFLLPYWAVLSLAIVLIIGTISRLRQKTKSLRYSLPSISRYACMVVLNIGTNQTFATPFTSPRITLQNTSDKDQTDQSKEKRNENKLVRSLSLGSKCVSDTEEAKNEGLIEGPFSCNYTELGQDEVEGHQNIFDSNNFLYGVFMACLIVQIWNRVWMIHLIPIPVIYYGIKKFSSRFHIRKYIERNVQEPLKQFYQSRASRTFFPEPLRELLRILYSGDRKMVSICEAYVDPVASLFVLVLVVVTSIVGIVFAASQIYAEGDHLVRVTSGLINSTVSQYPEINNILPEGWESIMNSMVGNAYLYGKEYITDMIRDSISEKNPEKAEQFEKQVIELWDRIYLAFNKTWENSIQKLEADDGNELNERLGWNDLLNTGRSVPQIFDLSLLANYAKANVGILWTIMESLWNVFVGNISLAFSAITAILSLLFGGGTAILNLIINLIVFFTTLFYLLSSSTNVYKPVEIFNLWSPRSGSHTNSFAIAVEDAINGVFVASFKMAVFYGMWTWLIHTLFQVNIVFIPSIFAALFGAVPFLMPYWAALPAALELWLIQGHWTKAIGLILAQMAPMSIVDTQIYSEIKGGGHPYLTGLTVAGGLFCLGFQGAIIGPVVLCCVVVAVKLGSSFMRDENEQLQRRSEYNLLADNNAYTSTPKPQNTGSTFSTNVTSS